MVNKEKVFQDPKNLTNTFCNVLMNCQELFEDLEFLEQEDIFKHRLKQQVKRLNEDLLQNINAIFAKLQNEKEKRSVLELYDESMKSRRDYRKLNFDERLKVNEILKREEFKK